GLARQAALGRVTGERQRQRVAVARGPVAREHVRDPGCQPLSAGREPGRGWPFGILLRLVEMFGRELSERVDGLQMVGLPLQVPRPSGELANGLDVQPGELVPRQLYLPQPRCR